MAVATKPITLDEIRATDGLDDYRGLEIVDGVWTPKHEGERLSIGHGKYGARLIGRLLDFADSHQLGDVYMSETVFVLHGNEQGVKTVRKPDIAYVSAERVKPPEEGYYFKVPDLAVEVISPSDLRPGVLHKKLTDYFTYGTKQVWLLYPDEKRIVVQNVDGTAATYEIGDTLTDQDLLPGFMLDLSALFKP
jgi:Uma2 family endonuclease